MASDVVFDRLSRGGRRAWREIAQARDRAVLDSFLVARFDADRDYWTLAAALWLEMWGHHHENRSDWRRVLSSPRAGREHLMTPAERRRLAALPDPLTVWRGFSGRPDGWAGFSWAARREHAAFYAVLAASPEGQSRGATPGRALIAEATVARRDVLAFFDALPGPEVLVLPESPSLVACRALTHADFWALRCALPIRELAA
ncbi:MAG: hypothetical protein U0R70_06430 [Solirubrobacteraceae bacterium]